MDFAVSLDKGCYNGQEILARLNTYKKVKQKLVGVQLECKCPPRQDLMFEDKLAGHLTTCLESPRFGTIGLAYVRNEWNAPGTELRMAGEDGQKVTVRAIPFAEV